MSNRYRRDFDLAVLTEKQQKELRRMHDTGEYSISDLTKLFTVSRPTIYRTLGRQRPAT